MQAPFPFADASRLRPRYGGFPPILLVLMVDSKGRNDDEAIDSLARVHRLPASDKQVLQEHLDILAEFKFQKEINYR